MLDPNFPPYNQTFNSTNIISCNLIEDGIIISLLLDLVLCIFGFPACIAVLWDLLEKWRRGTTFTPNDVFTLNITVMDSLFLAFLPLHVMNELVWQNLIIRKIISLVSVFNLSGRPLLMTCICLDCYTAVVHPITYRAHRSLFPRALITLAVWLATAAFGVLIIVRPQTMARGILTWSLTIALPVMVYCDCRILWTLRRSRSSGAEPHPQKKKALQIISTNLLTVVTVYVLPLVIWFIRGLFSISDHTFYCFVVIPISIPVTATSALMPLLSLRNMGKLRNIKPRCCSNL